MILEAPPRRSRLVNGRDWTSARRRTISDSALDSAGSDQGRLRGRFGLRLSKATERATSPVELACLFQGRKRRISRVKTLPISLLVSMLTAVLFYARTAFFMNSTTA